MWRNSANQGYDEYSPIEKAFEPQVPMNTRDPPDLNQDLQGALNQIANDTDPENSGVFGIILKVLAFSLLFCGRFSMGMLLTVLFSVLSLILFLAAGLQSELCNDTRCSRFGYPGLRVSENGLAYKWELSNSTLSCTVRGGNTKYYATLSRELYGMPDGSNTGSYVCNKCVYIKGYKAVIMAKVLGYCDSCSGGDIGLSTDAFKLVSGGNDIDMVPVVWRPCTN